MRARARKSPGSSLLLAAGDIHGRAVWLLLACLVAQMGIGSNYTISVLAPALLEDLGWSRGDYMAALSPRTIVAALASPLVGTLMYRFGARSILVVGVLLIGVVFGLYGAIQNLTHVFVLSMGFGLIIAGVGDVVVGTVVSQWIVRARGLALGIVYSGSNLGGLVFALLAARVLEVSDWRTACVAIGVVAVVVMLPIVFLGVREPRSEDAPAPRVSDVGEPTVSTESVTLTKAIRTESFWLLLFALFVFYFYYASVTSHFVLFLTDVGMSTAAASVSFGLTIFVGVGAKIGIGLFADRFPAKTALLIDFGVVAAASSMLLVLPEAGILLPVFVVSHGLAVAAQNVVYPLIVAWCFGVGHMAKIYGVLMLALLPGGTLGPIFAGYTFELFGNYDFAFRVFVGLNVLSFLGLCRLRSAQEPTVRLS